MLACGGGSSPGGGRPEDARGAPLPAERLGSASAPAHGGALAHGSAPAFGSAPKINARGTVEVVHVPDKRLGEPGWERSRRRLTPRGTREGAQAESRSTSSVRRMTCRQAAEGSSISS